MNKLEGNQHRSSRYFGFIVQRGLRLKCKLFIALTCYVLCSVTEWRNCLTQVFKWFHDIGANKKCWIAAEILLMIIIIGLTGLNEDTKKEFPAFAKQVLILYR